LDDAYADESQGFGAAGQHDRRLRKSRIGEDSEADIRKLFKRNILDSLGCAIAGLPGAPFAALREQFAEKKRATIGADTPIKTDDSSNSYPLSGRLPKLF
jgi:hypothetical protein